jgi:hypothetical protein
MTEDLREDPHTGINWHRHPRGCPNYRERWLPDTDTRKGEPLYQVFCFLNTPPTTADEQAKCLVSHTACWRLKGRAAAKSAASGTASSEPSASAEA